MCEYVEMSSTIQKIKNHKSCDQYIHMQHLLPFTRENNEHEIYHNLTSIIPYATLRMRNVSHSSDEECANAIVNHLQSSNKFMQDDPISEQFRMKTLRAIPQCLSVKRSIKLQLLESIDQKIHKQPITYWKWIKYNISLKFRKIWVTVQNLSQTMKLWHQTIKTIESHNGSGVATYFKFLRLLLFLNIISCFLSIFFVVIPQSMVPQTQNQTQVSKDIKILDFLTGSGFFSYTIMYYGFYSNSIIDLSFETKYSIPYAYFLTLLFSYIITFIILSVKVISSYRKSYVEIHAKTCDLYSNKIFCGWDYSISSQKVAILQSASIYKELEEMLAEMRQHEPLHCLTKCLLIILRFSVTIVVMFMIYGIGSFICMLLIYHNTEIPGSLSVMLVPMIVTIIIHIFPIIMSCFTFLECYRNKRIKLYVTVVRNYAVATTIFSSLFAFWIINSTSDCWQTDFGGEIYRLIILDFIASVFGVYLQFAHSALYKQISTKINRPEFDIARNTFNLIYNQMLFWMGFYFSPMMSLIIVMKLIFTFYIKKYELKKCYQRPLQPWRAAQTQTLFLALTFLGLIGALFTIGYIITNIESNDCGPFRDHLYTWDFIVDGMLSLKRDSTFWNVILILTRPASGAAILIGMCVALYCLRAKVEASKKMLQILSEMIFLQSEDKQFLIKHFDKLANERSTSATDASGGTSLTQNVEFIEQNHENEDILISPECNFPSTSFEKS